MKWKDLEITTLGDLSDLVVEIVASHDLEAATELVKTYSRQSPFAITNIGYLSAAYDPEFGEQVRKAFSVNHPVLGDKVSTIDRRLVEQVHLPVHEDFAKYSSYKSK